MESTMTSIISIISNIVLGLTIAENLLLIGVPSIMAVMTVMFNILSMLNINAEIYEPVLPEDIEIDIEELETELMANQITVLKNEYDPFLACDEEDVWLAAFEDMEVEPLPVPVEFQWLVEEAPKCWCGEIHNQSLPLVTLETVKRNSALLLSEMNGCNAEA